MTGSRFTAAVLALVAVLAASPTIAEEPCNPILHGTYCALDKRPIPSGGPTGKSFEPMRGIASDIFPSQVPAATLGTITINSTSRCLALIRRSGCTGD